MKIKEIIEMTSDELLTKRRELAWQELTPRFGLKPGEFEVLSLLESQKVPISGTCLPCAAGSGLATVRAQIQAMTLASPPP